MDIFHIYLLEQVIIQQTLLIAVVFYLYDDDDLPYTNLIDYKTWTGTF